jgi:hypothetical protein
MRKGVLKKYLRNEVRAIGERKHNEEFRIL